MHTWNNTTNDWLSFDDVLLKPRFSTIRSREECDTGITFGANPSARVSLDLPIISANMDTITGHNMAIAMSNNGGMGAIHRFCTIDENVEMFRKNKDCFVSFGAGKKEVERALCLYEEGASNFILDVAHGASISAVEAYNQFRSSLSRFAQETTHVMVGNFADREGVLEFVKNVKIVPDSFKVGIGGGSMCTTRIVTGVGAPTFSSVCDVVSTGYPVVADGGIRNSGDVAKCLAAGANAVMIGSMLSGTDETPGDVELFNDVPHKVYRGSASKESYEAQGKVASHRTPEGESTFVLLKGSANNILQTIKAGLQSSMSYLNATELAEFRENAKFVRITSSGMAESRAHGKR
jgi:IMP dehydrogenase